jgi:hypothetical protein
MLDQQKYVMPTGLQILSQVEVVKATGVKPLKEVIGQLITKG